MQVYRSKAPPLVEYLARFQELKSRSKADMAIIQAVRLRRSDALMEAIFDRTADGILVFRPDLRIEAANDAAGALFGLPKESLMAMPANELMPGLVRGTETMDASTIPPGTTREVAIKAPDGQERTIELTMGHVAVGTEVLLVAVLHDISQRKRQEAQLRHQALHDPLTGLPNRVLLIDRLEQALALAKRERRELALLMLDLDRFKDVNDTLGHQAGDRLLQDVAQRLVGCLRASDSIALLGGDEFAVLLPVLANENDALDAANRIVNTLRRPFGFNELVISIDVSIGIAFCPSHAMDSQKLMQCADIAMYAAKRGPNQIETYDHTSDQNSIRQLTLSGELRRSIQEGHLGLRFQPKLDLHTLTVCGAEALSRWHHPVHGDIPPSEFIAQAERTGAIHDLTSSVLDKAMAQVARLGRAGHAINIAVNLSARGLHDDNLPSLVYALLKKWRINPQLLTCEITESSIMFDPDKALLMIEKLVDLGIKISIDDFGTGYSSLSYLSRLPASELKIDRSFVARMMAIERDHLIVTSTIDLAHNLGLIVVAEGVETLDIVHRLARIGCDCAQGYYFARPMEADDLLAWIERASAGDVLRDLASGAA